MKGEKMSNKYRFKSFYVNRPKPVYCVPDTETKFVDQSEADRASLKYQLERYGMDSLMQQFEKTKSQFGYADTRVAKNFVELQQKMAEANSYFMELPSRIRAKFHHSATEFFSNIETDPEKMYKDGYISKSLAAELGVISEQDKLVDVTPITPVVNTTTTELVEPSDNENLSA